ncbi:uncharacterized protein ACR2FA_008094 [Aphomia sociella]
MALDKQRILNELGSVVNQLQSADCGCMGKLFSNSGQGSSMGAPLPTCGGCRRGCCHGHGFQHGSAPCAGEPCSNMNPMNNPVNRSCMGHCNPPKLYGDTYNYLNENLMQPTIKDVYNDLKTITPANTVMNNPMASQMGISQGNTGMPTQNNMAGMNQSSMPGEADNTMQSMGAMPPGYSLHMGHTHNSQQMNSNIQNNLQTGQTNPSMGQMSRPMCQTGGMGAQIVNMMMGNAGPKGGVSGQGAPLTEPMLIDAPQSPHGKVGVAPLSSPQQGAQNTGMGMTNMNYGQQSCLHPQNPVTQYSAQQNTYTGNNGEVNSVIDNMTRNNMTPGSHAMGQSNNIQPLKSNPAALQMPNQRYGQHSPGMTKFNEMFPGIMQAGDLGFDPMAIAIQMNPANQQKTAMDTMQKMMSGNGINKVMDTSGNSVMQPVVNEANAASIGIAQGNAPNLLQNQQSSFANNQIPNQTNPSQHIPSAGHINQPLQQQLNISNNVTPTDQIQQQVYSAHTGAPMMNQQQISSQHAQQYQLSPQYPQQQQYQQIVDPNNGAAVNTSNYPVRSETSRDPNAQSIPSAQSALSSSIPLNEMIKEPIFPVDISRNQSMHTKPQKYYQYNTLGQPVEMLSAKMYHPPEPTLPQTLSPQPIPMKLRNDPMKYSNVKNTVSKTSITGNRALGKTASRSQLQNIYNQYKGSQSYTQQNIKPVPHGHGATYSEGNVTYRDVNPRQQVPVEKFGGDTVANNAMINKNMPAKTNQLMEQIGDVPNTNKPQGETAPAEITPVKTSKCRNGLQDMVYTSYPTSAAWSFHGNNRVPFSAGYRFRNRAY